MRILFFFRAFLEETKEALLDYRRGHTPRNGDEHRNDVNPRVAVKIAA